MSSIGLELAGYKINAVTDQHVNDRAGKESIKYYGVMIDNHDMAVKRLLVINQL